MLGPWVGSVLSVLCHFYHAHVTSLIKQAAKIDNTGMGVNFLNTTKSDIDFSDKLDEPIKNLDSMMSQAMASREIDMNSTFPPPPPQKTNKSSSNNFVTNLVIGGSVDISSEPITIETTESHNLKTIIC